MSRLRNNLAYSDSPDKVTQLTKPTEWWEVNVKCCANCPGWAVGFFDSLDRGTCVPEGWFTYWFWCCPQYFGEAPEDNLQYSLEEVPDPDEF